MRNKSDKQLALVLTPPTAVSTVHQEEPKIEDSCLNAKVYSLEEKSDEKERFDNAGHFSEILGLVRHFK